MSCNTTFDNPKPYLQYLARSLRLKMQECRYIQSLIARDFDAIRGLEFRGDGFPFANLSNSEIESLLKDVFGFKEFFQIANDLKKNL